MPAADRQFRAEVFEQCIGEAEVALCILEVDRVDLVRHRRRTDFPGLEHLAEVAERNVAPDVAREVDQYRVRAAYRIADLGDAVVWFDLRRVRVEHQAKVLDEASCKRWPVDFGVGGHVCVVVADRAIDLAGQLDRGDLTALAFEPREHVRDLLA